MASSSGRTLSTVIATVLPRCVEQLSASQQLQSPSWVDLSEQLASYNYDFLDNPAWKPVFGKDGREPARQRSSDGRIDQDDDDGDPEETETWTLSGAQIKGDVSGLSSEYLHTRKGKPCGHIFRKGESVYRCKECSLDDSCVLCMKCFKASDHEGHEVSFSMHNGGCGCCDCGDSEAWKREIGCAYHNANVPYPKDPSNAQQQLPLRPIPAELVEVIRFRVRETIDFIIEAITFFPHSTEAPHNPHAILVSKPVIPLPSADYSNESENFQGPWSILLWNDEKHSYHQVIEQLVSSTRCSRSQGYAAASQIDSYGQVVIATSTDATHLWKVAQTVAAIDLGVTVCTSRDAVILEAVGLQLEWLEDLVKVRAGGDETILSRVVAEVLLQDQRLAMLLRVEDRIWKRARASIRNILMALLVVGQDCKIQLGVQYASVYPALMSSYLLTDREPENSVTQFSIQLFSAPSVATHLVTHHNFLVIVLQLLYSFFTQQHFGPHGQKVISLPPSTAHPPVDPDSTSFKHKRYFHIFQDLNHILAHPGVMQHLVNQQDNAFKMLVTFLNLFTVMNPLTRASSVHVEYETDSWVTAFNLTIQLSKLAKNVGKAFNSCQRHNSPEISPGSFVRAITQLVSQMKKQMTSKDERGLPKADLHHVWFAGKGWKVNDFQVSSQTVSFHHPLHLLYAEMMKSLLCWPNEQIQAVTRGYCPDFPSLIAFQNNGGQNPFFRMLDEVLRVLALLAQIRAGLWVRNGFGVRAQQSHYREWSLRENTFDQDIYFLQTAFVTVEPSEVLVTMLDRFELLPILSTASHQTLLTDGKACVYDRTQAIAVLEEFLNLLIITFSEPTDIEAMDAEHVVRRELIHTLLLGPYSYSEVVKNVTERVAEETCFDRVLAEVASFRAPDPTILTSDIGGVYTLDKAYLAEVDPYFFRYTRNQREEAAKLLKTQTGNKGVFAPRKLRLKGAFGQDNRFTSTFTTAVFREILRSSLQYAVQSSDYAETVVDLAMHLLNMALVEQTGPVCAELAGTGILLLLCQFEVEERTKEMHPRISSMLDIMAKYQPAEVSKHRIRKDTQVAGAPTGAAVQAEQKRIAAKARQAAIMQQFAAASKSFLAEHDTSDDEDEDEEPDEPHDMISSEMNDETDLAEEESEFGRTAILAEAAKVRKRRKAPATMGSCIVCQEELTTQRAFGSLGLVQTSSFIRLFPRGQPGEEEYFNELDLTPTDLDKDASDMRRTFDPTSRFHNKGANRGGSLSGFPRKTQKGLFASACGHMMHVTCFETYCSSISQRHSQQFSRNHPENIDRKEYICPLCKSLGNVLLPLAPEDFEKDSPLSDDVAGISEKWLNEAIKSCSLSDGEMVRISSMLFRYKNGNGGLRAWRIPGNFSPQASLNVHTISQSERHMLDRLIQVISPLDAECHMLSSSEHGSRLISHELIAYTISSIEIALRGRQTGTLGVNSIPEATSKLIRSLLFSLERLVSLSTGTFRGKDFARLATIWLMFGQRTASANHQHFLNRDPFTALVEMTAVAPDEFYQFATLTFYAHLIRISYKLYIDDSGDRPSRPPASVDAMSVAEFCRIMQEGRWARSGANVSESIRQRCNFAAMRTYTHALPFLRRAAILHNTIYTSSRPSSTTSLEDGEFARLLSLLHIPNPVDILGRRHGKSPHRMTSLSSVIEEWDTTWLQPAPFHLEPIVHDKISLEHPVIYELLELPNHLEELIESTIYRKCSRCRLVPSNPAICLLCGELVCQQSLCCMDHDSGEESSHGECNTHMWECGTSTGIFFLIKRCVIIYLYADKGTFATAPYLDSHGEADPDLRKNRPLYLNQARYDEIRKLWLNHSIATVVARRLESSSDSGGWNSF